MRAAFGDLLRLCTVDLRRPARSDRHVGSVVHLMPSMAWGGAERLACTMHRLASAAGWRSRVDAPGVAAVCNGIAEETGTASNSSPTEESDLRAWAIAARQRIARERPDVVHAHLPYPDRLGTALLAARGRPLVATFQLLPDRDRYWSLDELIGNRSDNVLRVLSRMPSRVRFVAVSRDDHERLSVLIPGRRLVHVANAPPYPRRAAPLRAYEWPQGTVRLLSAGRLHDQKGYDRLMAALGSSPARDLAWHWVLAGDGPQRSTLETAAREHGIRDRIAFAPEYPASVLYAQADVVLAPSRWEGMPLVPMEAIESGTTVLASDIAPHRELFDAAPDSLLPADESTWSSSLARVIESADRRTALRRQQASCLAPRARESMWQSYESVYRSLAGV